MIVFYFNPRSRMGNDDSPLAVPYPVNEFQSTFPHGERPMVSGWSECCSTISIHVPAWGTTKPMWILSTLQKFQSTFQHGERRLRILHRPSQVYFNPRSRMGNDTSEEYCFSKFSYISIHVPAWGTTANFHKYSLLFYAINIIFLLFIIPSLFSLVLFILLF